MQRLKRNLKETEYNLNNLSVPDLVRISQELDELIICYQMLTIATEEQKSIYDVIYVIDNNNNKITL
ncbi:Spo0E family sporulation regulatory protein-aspartic acid phosphatase [Fictibacillus phosphorivorans]|uniref:Spo0E family sporulation regulatory protein-aspartic acid phosphatase n=1 Tax=Fictibacillus phosphorivorans TaxID=1221500 RepID=UPI003AF8892B